MPIQAASPWISHADLWSKSQSRASSNGARVLTRAALAGCTAIEAMGGPRIPWQPGRTDYNSAPEAEEHRGQVGDRLPDGAKGADHIRDVFSRMGFSDQELVALSGAHNLGRCHTDRSGFDGAWVVNPTRFSNQYFKLLLARKWVPRKWDGPFQWVSRSTFKKERRLIPKV